MNELSKKIDELAPEGRRQRHSFFQLQYFVIGKEPTVQSKMQACKNELIVRKDEIESFLTMIEESYDNYRIEELRIEEIKQNRHPDQLNEVEQINIRNARRKMKVIDYQIEDFKQKLRGKEEEANFLIGLFEKLCEIEEPKDWDSLEVQGEYWNARLTQEIETRLLLGNPPEPEVLKSIYAMPEGLPVKDTIRQLIKHRQEALGNRENTEADVDTQGEIEDGRQTEQLG